MTRLGFLIISVLGAHAFQVGIKDDSAIHDKQDGPERKATDMQGVWGTRAVDRTKCALKECKNHEDCSDHLYNMLVSLADWFDANGVEYYVSQGTLLGAVRDHDIIPWTADVDIFVTEAGERKLVDNAKADLGFWAGKASIVRVCDSLDGPATLLQGTGKSSLSSRFHFYAVSDAESQTTQWDVPYYVDIYRIKNSVRDYAKVGGRAKWGHFSQDDVMKLFSKAEATTVTIRGKTFKAPGKAEELLMAKYGPDWRIPLASHQRGGR